MYLLALEVMVLGGSEKTVREEYSRSSLNLCGRQEKLLQAVYATGKPVILLLVDGRAATINWAERYIPGIVHVDAFNDPLIDNRDSKKRYRADVLIEEQIAKYDDKIDKEVAKAAKRFGEAFDEAQFRTTNGRVLENLAKRDALHAMRLLRKEWYPKQRYR